MVDHTFLFSPPVMELKQIIRNGDFGRILYVHSTRLNLGLFQEDINVLWDLLPHDLSIVDDLLNTHPLEVSAQGAANIDPRYEDVAFVTVYYENGLLAHFHVSWLDPCKTRRMTLVGDNKMAVYDDMDSNEPIRIYDKRVSRLPYFTDFGEFKLHYRFGDIHSPRIQMTEPLKRVCSHFLESIQKGTTPQSDGRTGLRIVRVLEAAEESLAHRGRIQRIQPE
jgi:predicted dehydrogenase